MSWPLSQDYNEAIQSPAANFTDPDLKRGEAVTNPLGIPLPCSGSFADVYEVRCPDGGRWAVKCFTREVAGLRERYTEVSRHLRQVKLPFTVDFTYLEQGIRVAGRWYPVLKMQWVEGLSLNQFVGKYADKPAMLESLLHVWVRMAGYLKSVEIAHGDLQHGNILLVPGPTANSLALKLIDYDGMFVPALAGQPSGEFGHPCYQHPERMRDRIYGADEDRFPLLLVATALAYLMAGGRSLWEKYDTGENLLFREVDLRAPMKSELFRELFKLNSALGGKLLGQLFEALRGRLEATPLLDGLVGELLPARPKLKRASVVRQKQSESTAGQLGRVNCPHCSREVYYDDEMIAQIAACPYCDKALQIPSSPSKTTAQKQANGKEPQPAAKDRSETAGSTAVKSKPNGTPGPRKSAPTREPNKRTRSIWAHCGVTIVALAAGFTMRPFLLRSDPPSSPAPNPEPPQKRVELQKQVELPDKAPVSVLRRALWGGDAAVKKLALDQLAIRGSEAARAMFDIADMLTTQNNPTPVRCRAAEVIGGMGAAARPVLPDLSWTLEDGDPKVCAATATAIVEIVKATGGDRESWESVGKALVKALKQDKDSSVRQSAAQGLSAFGPRAVDELCDCLKDKDASVRSCAADALGSMGKAGAARVASLVNMAEQETDLEAKQSVLKALTRLAGPEDKALAGRLGPLLQDKDVKIAVSAALVLIRISGEEATQTLPVLQKALKDSDVDVQELAAAALGKFGPKAKPALFDLADALANPANSEDVRSKAALAISHIGAAAEPVVPTLAEALKPTEPVQVRRYAAEALSQMRYPANEKALASLLRTIQRDSDDMVVRQRCVFSLGQMKDLSEGGADKVLTRVLKETSVDQALVRYDAARILAEKLGEKAPDKTSDVLLDMLKNKTLVLYNRTDVKLEGSGDKFKHGKANVTVNTGGDARYLAARALGQLGTKAKNRPDVLEALKKAAEDKEPELKKAAENALKELKAR